MKKVAIKPVWTIQEGDGPALPARLLELLVQVQSQGSLLAACQRLGMSYRHAWELVRQGEAQFSASLLRMERGKGSTLSALGEKLVWADHRIHARLGPVLDSLASELAGEIGRVIALKETPGSSQVLLTPSGGLTQSDRSGGSEQPSVLRIQASHGYAIEALVESLGATGLVVERKYGSSTEAAAALRDRACDAAGFHIPTGPLQAAALALYARWLDDADLMVIDIATRRQGLMVAPGNPKKIYELADLARPGQRFINRQAGSGTRFLLEGLLAQQGISADAIAGFEQGEFTHAAVAAYVASGMADVGFGLETPARQFKLDFLPLASERYFLLCHASALELRAMQAVLSTLGSPAFQATIDALPGYHAQAAGRLTPLAQAFSA